MKRAFRDSLRSGHIRSILPLLLPGIFFLFFSAQYVWADQGAGAELELKRAVGLVVRFLHDERLDRETRRSRILEVINTTFDFPLIAKLTLGKRYWPKLNREQKREFVRLFTAQLENTYYTETDSFADESIEFERPVFKKNKIEILTRVFPKASKKVDVLYKLYKGRGKWKVYDIEIQGVSMISSFRSQYREFLKRGSVEEFLQKMRDKANRE